MGADVLADPDFLLSVTLAAATTVFLATRARLSHFHHSTPLLAGLLALASLAPGGVELILLGSRFALPLLIAPLLALALTLGLYYIFTTTRKALGIHRETCVCIASSEHVVAINMPPLQPVVGADWQLVDAFLLWSAHDPDRLARHGGGRTPLPPALSG